MAPILTLNVPLKNITYLNLLVVVLKTTVGLMHAHLVKLLIIAKQQNYIKTEPNKKRVG